MKAIFLITRSKYSPEAMIGFWERLQNTDAYPDKEIRLNRNFTPRQRVLMLEKLMPKIPEWTNQENRSKES